MEGDGALSDFTAVVAAHKTRMFRLAWLLTHDRDEAEDLVADAFAAMFARTRRPAVDGDGDGGIADMGAYLRRTMINRMVGSSRRRRRLSFEPTADLDPVAAESSAGAGAVDTADAMAWALRQLSVQQRAVLALRYYEGLSEQEIASSLGVTVGAVKTHAHRGIARLRQLLDPADAT